jgi:hypothetical protein
VFDDKLPKRVEPVMKLTDDVIVCTTSVCAVIVPVEVIEPVMLREPVIVVLPLTSKVELAVVLPIPTLPLTVAKKDDVFTVIVLENTLPKFKAEVPKSTPLAVSGHSTLVLVM